MIEIRERDQRNVELFGAKGQLRLKQANALIVGAGGLGSPLAQHLALLGVGNIAAADDEELSETNRNRFVGAFHSDSVPGTLKVDIIGRLIHAIDPSIAYQGIPHSLLSAEVFQAVRQADWVFGCFDEDGPRMILSELSIAYDKPYFDLASDVPMNGVYGGRVTLSQRGTGCLKCLGLLDQADIRAFFATDDANEARDRIYGIDRSLLDERGPSVSPINGVVAALAATEFMVAVTQMRPPTPNLEYRGHQSKVVVSVDSPQPDCPICAMRGRGSEAQVERYLSLDYLRERRARKTLSASGTR
ncbi:ThiF family adenylyltransferase [Sphingomonas sp. ID1715]|uniref:HesA/MoeB/ThiF family protein n=1 Tax=Sphingomonas sp. ID1715 TaxID=1656898 RepID=UPI0014886757|nr:ThiF family adenylyltransferase [Sphingomonas sp. ID1715]